MSQDASSTPSSRWKHEYLTSLREFHGSTGDNRQRIKIGDVVLVHDEGPRINWHLAVIKDLIIGGEKLVRTAIIRTSAGETNCPITKLYPLEVRTDGLPNDPNGDHKESNENELQASTTASASDHLIQRESAKDATNHMAEWIQALRAPSPEDV